MVNAARDKAITDHRSCHTVAQLVSTSPITALPEHIETVEDAIDYSEHPVVSHPTATVTGSTVVDVHMDPVVSHPTAAVTASGVVDVHVDPVVSHPNAAVTGAVVENVEIIDDNSQSSVEVFSALMTFLDMAAVRMQPKKLIAWSDSCAGQNLPHQLQLVKKTVDDAGNRIQLRDKVHWIQMSEFGSYRYRHTFSDDEEWKVVTLRRKNADVPDSLFLPVLPKRHVPIKPSKLSDIQKQLRFIPTIYQRMYLDLCSQDDGSEDIGDASISSSDETSSVVGLETNQVLQYHIDANVGLLYTAFTVRALHSLSQQLFWAY